MKMIDYTFHQGSYRTRRSIFYTSVVCDRNYSYGSSRQLYDSNLDPTTYIPLEQLGFKKKMKNLRSKAANWQKNELNMGMEKRKF